MRPLEGAGSGQTSPGGARRPGVTVATRALSRDDRPDGGRGRRWRLLRVAPSEAGGRHRRVGGQVEPVEKSWLEFRLLQLSLVWLMLIPAQVAVVGPLQSNGSLPRLLGLAFLALAAILAISSLGDAADSAEGTSGGVRVVAWLLLAQTLLSSVIYAEDASDFAQANAVRGVLVTASGVGLLLGIMALARTAQSIDRLMAVVAVGGATSAVVGILQALNAVDSWALVFSLPGLQQTVEGGVAQERSGLTRVLGTAGHPIEYSAVLVAALVLSLHLTRHGGSPLVRRVSGASAIVMAAGLPLGLSRTSLACIGVSLGFYAVMMDRSTRLRLVGGAVVAGVAVSLLLPEYAYALYGSVTSSGADRSISGRLSDYPLVLQSVAESPVFGQYIPVRGLILDNQWLGLLANSGLLGLAMFVVFLGYPLFLGLGQMRDLQVADRSRLAALMSGVLCLTTGFFTYDVLSFGQSALLIFVLVGLLSAALGARTSQEEEAH
jgi:O-antigen ligase